MRLHANDSLGKGWLWRLLRHSPDVVGAAGWLRSRLLAAGAALAFFAVGALSGPAVSSAATPVACGYGTGGAQAQTLCWLDMSAYSFATSSGVSGQPMTVTLPGGYTISFTMTTRANGALAFSPLNPVAFPTWGGAYTGNHAYLSTPGKPALYQTQNHGGDVLTLSNISVTDSSGAPVNGYGFVVADAESTDLNESLTLSSNVPLQQISTSTAQYPYCGHGLTGVGTTTVTCTGGQSGGTSDGAIVLQANQPTQISAALVGGGLQAVAFAIVTSKITLTKAVVGRAQPSDSFDLSLTSPEGTLVGSASTGSANSASTGALTVLPRSNGSSYTLSENPTPGSGTRMSDYSESWSCTNATTTSSTVLPSGSSTSVLVAPAAGDNITCTVTNTALTDDLSITKVAAPSPAVPGTDETFTLTVHNAGPVSATNVVVSDPFSAGLSFVSGSPGCGFAAGTVTCTLSTLASGASQSFTVTGHLASSLKVGIVNTATVTSATPDSNPNNNSATVNAPFGPKADVEIQKTPSTSSVPAGGQVMYTLLVKNNGPSDVSGVTVSDPLPGEMTVVSATPSQGDCSTSAGVVCKLGTVVAGGAAQVLVTANVAASGGGSVSNTASVTSDQPDPHLANNSSTSTINVQPAPALPPPPPPGTQPPPVTPPPPVATPQPTSNLGIVVHPSSHSAYPGQKITYTLTVTNLGPNAASDAKLIDTSSLGLRVLSVHTGKGKCRSGVPISCGLGTIAPGQRVKIKVVAEVKQTGDEDNAASVTSTSTDSDSANNFAAAKTKVARALRLRKTASVRSASAGQNVSYTLTVSNPTLIAIARVTVCDRLPAGLLFVSSTPPAHLSAGRFCWSISKLGAGGSDTLALVVNAEPGASGPKVNRATATAPGVRSASATATIRLSTPPLVPCGAVSAAAPRTTTGRTTRASDPTAHPAC
jgi:uncharacterized repeat protein (TIGR01451 family)